MKRFRRVLFYLILLVFSFSEISQSKSISGHYEDAVTKPHLLSSEEKEVLNYINLMRKDPAEFYHTHLAPYIKSDKRFTNYYISSLKKEMLHSGPLLPFTVSSVMEKTASYQAADLARFNGKKLDHTSSNGTTFEQRMKKAGVNCAGENLYAGENRSLLKMIMDLLIDEGVRNLGHRKALLSIQYKSIGISIQYYSSTGKIMVQDFSCQQ